MTTLLILLFAYVLFSTHTIWRRRNSAYNLFSALQLIIVWYDVWFGLYYDEVRKRYYLMIPFIGLVWDAKRYHKLRELKRYDYLIDPLSEVFDDDPMDKLIEDDLH